MTAADENIAKALADRQSFVLDAGAGSGKTFSLIQALTMLRRNGFLQALINGRQKIACITYTNVAKDEINLRTENDPLITVATIHEFLWELIKDYQDELRAAVRRFNAELPSKSSRKKDADELDAALAAKIPIEYSEFGSNLLEGRIFHDDLLEIAHIMFEENPLLAKLTAAQYPFIFVDEYQDTSPLVVSILLDHIRTQASKPVIGFFGDKKQAIYDHVIGELSAAHKETLAEIKKEENYRCAKAVIKILNKLRADIEQTPAGDNVEGAAIYVGVPAAKDISVKEAYDAARPHLVDPPEVDGTKSLYLTHRLISQEAGYANLFAVYNKRGGYRKDKFQSGEDTIASFLAFDIDQLAANWRAGDQAAALAQLQEDGYKLTSFEQRASTKAALDQLSALISQGAPICDVVAHVDACKILRFPDALTEGVELAAMSEANVKEEDEKNYVFFRELLGVDSREVTAYRNTMQNNTPYSTKHGVKGDEFDHVIVVVDDAGARWTKYAFGKQFEGSDTSAARWDRTSNLLYVCCSRAKINLVVVDLGYDEKRKEGVDRIFEENQIIL